MLKSLELENFKAFGTRTRIEFAPITLIFGENSAGKSSILQCLNLLKQTRESREPGALLLPRAENGLVDLGSFQELLFDHELSRSLSVKVEVSDGVNNRHRNFPFLPEEVASLAIEATFRRPSPDAEVDLEGLQVFAEEASPIVRFEPTATPREDMLRGWHVFDSARGRRMVRQNLRAAKCVWVSEGERYWKREFDFVRAKRPEIQTALRAAVERLEGSPERQRRTRLPFTLADLPKQERGELLSKLRRDLEFISKEFDLRSFIQRMCAEQLDLTIALDGFLPFSVFGRRSPINLTFREFSDSFHEFSFESSHLDIGAVTLSASRAIEETLDRLFPLAPYRRAPERWYIFTGTSPQDVGYRGDLLPDLLFRRHKLVDQANQWLERLDVGYSLRVEPLERSKDLFEVRLVDRRRNAEVEVSLVDVGFGISQILPFVVQSLTSSNQIIAIEQPEVHLHPKLQADLGDLVAEASKERSNQFIIETHSEHLILRIQRLIREKRLLPEDVCVIHVSRGSAGARAQRLQLDGDGSFADDWPGGFFPERLRELS